LLRALVLACVPSIACALWLAACDDTVAPKGNPNDASTGGKDSTPSADAPSPTEAAPHDSLPSVYERGIYAEAAWMVTGQHRVHGAWPVTNGLRAFTGGAVEVAGRAERLDLGLGAPGVTPGGATAFAFGARWWATRFCALSAAAYHTRYDTPPIEEPTRQGAWLGLGRLTIFAP